jgi:hypothetical protein
LKCRKIQSQRINDTIESNGRTAQFKDKIRPLGHMSLVCYDCTLLPRIMSITKYALIYFVKEMRDREGTKIVSNPALSLSLASFTLCPLAAEQLTA